MVVAISPAANVSLVFIISFGFLIQLQLFNVIKHIDGPCLKLIQKIIEEEWRMVVYSARPDSLAASEFIEKYLELAGLDRSIY